jgi:hypothetical protein
MGSLRKIHDTIDMAKVTVVSGNQLRGGQIDISGFSRVTRFLPYPWVYL